MDGRVGVPARDADRTGRLGDLSSESHFSSPDRVDGNPRCRPCARAHAVGTSGCEGSAPAARARSGRLEGQSLVSCEVRDSSWMDGSPQVGHASLEWRSPRRPPECNTVHECLTNGWTAVDRWCCPPDRRSSRRPPVLIPHSPKRSFSWCGVSCILHIPFPLARCTTANSPVTTGVTGNFKAIFATWIGFAWFGSSLSLTGWAGLLLSTLGGCLYSASTLLGASARRKAEDAKAP